jgi:hypothetical protein
MGKQKTLGELWDAGLVSGSGRISDGELQALADRSEAQLAALPPGSLRPRREGRPRKGEPAQPTVVRSIRLGENLWALVAIAADEDGVSVNKWIEQAICQRLKAAPKTLSTNPGPSVAQGPKRPGSSWFRTKVAE